MADITTQTCRTTYDTFLQNRHPVFVFLRLGPLCNASRSFSFTNAYCDIERIKSQRQGVPGPGQTKAVDMDDLFSRGFQVLQSEEEKYLSTDERNAVIDLNNFLQNIEVHQRNLVNAIDIMKTEQSKETPLSMAIAEHLFSNLASGYSYGIDKRVQGKAQDRSCTCNHEKPVKFAPTGIGHHKVWHGYVDMMWSEKKDQSPVGAVNLVTDRCLSDPGEEEEPTKAKRAKFTDDVTQSSQCADSISELKMKNIADQKFSQTIVFALAQKQLRPDNESFIPNILISEKHFCIIMYDPTYDILIRSEKIPLWSYDSSSSLEILAVITLWMVIHYKLFCSSGEIFETLNEVKAEFMEHVIEDRRKFFKQLDIGVENFETEETDELSKDLTLHMFEKVKLKKCDNS